MSYGVCQGTNDEEVPEELVKLLKFVGAQPSESEKDFEDAFVKRLQNSIREVKASREMGARHMIFQEMLQEERAEGRPEGRAEGDRNRLIMQVRKKLERGDSVEKIADDLVEEVSVIEEIIADIEKE